MKIKDIIDLTAIILPALIILLGIIRVFLKKTRGVNGLTMIFAILLLLVGLVRFYFFPNTSSGCDCGTKAEPVKVSKHTPAFNQSVEVVVSSYGSLIDGFSANDPNAISLHATTLASALDSLRMDELKVDTLIYETAVQFYESARAEAQSILTDPSIDEKKGSLNILSDNLNNLLRTVRYDLAKLYWQECDRAFGEGKPGNWLSKSEQSRNPYGQPDCAEIRTTINFMPADTTKKP